jgi:hypothetical protein
MIETWERSMDSRLPVVGALAFSGTFLTGILTAGSAAAAVRPPSGSVNPEGAQAVVAAQSAPLRAAGKPSSPVHGPRCDSSQPRGDDAAYQGLSVSVLYDRLFHAGAVMPHLSTHVPQSLRTWYDWDGHGHDLVLLGMYRENHDSYLVGIDPNSEHVVGTVRVAPSHLGGMAFLGSWLFTGDNPWPLAGSPTVTRYRISDLREAMREAIDTGEAPYLRSDGPRENVHATDFMVAAGESIYAGNHGQIHGRMYRYRLTDDGWLRAVDGPWVVPPRAQGMIVARNRFIFSSDNGAGRGWLTVVDRDEPARPVSCIWVPAMPEAIETYDGRLMMAFESGAAPYAYRRAENHITHLHTAALAPLLALTELDAVTHYKARLRDVTHLIGKLGRTSHHTAESRTDHSSNGSGDD